MIDHRSTPRSANQNDLSNAGPGSRKNEIERLIAEIWQDVLRVKRVGRDDKFFEIGGNSLHLVQVHQRLQERFGKDLRITDLFRLPTIRTLAEYLHERAERTVQNRQRSDD